MMCFMLGVVRLFSDVGVVVWLFVGMISISEFVVKLWCVLGMIIFLFIV